MKLILGIISLVTISSTVFAADQSMPTSDKITLNCTVYSDGDGPMPVELVKKDDENGYRYEGSEIGIHKKFNFVYRGLQLTISSNVNGVTVSTNGTDLSNRPVDWQSPGLPGVYLQVGEGEKAEAVNCYGFSDHSHK